jgi:hypothetical protein
MQKIFKSPVYLILFLLTLHGIWSIFSYRDYRNIDKNKIPAFIIQQGKLSKNQIADLTKLSDAKNIWVINDKEDFNRATELIKQSADAISYANQVGRLDLVSMLLTVIVAIFGLSGIVGFLHIKEGVGVKTQFAINENKNQLDQKIKEIEKDTKEHFKTSAKKYFEDGGEASKIIRSYVAQEFDKNNIEIEAEDEQELN